MMWRRRRSERGQSTAEFALLIPVLVLFALVIVQVVVLARNQLRLVEACRNAARVLIVAPDMSADDLVDRIDARSLGVSFARETDASQPDLLRVACTRSDRTDVPIVGVLLPNVNQSERFTVLVERP